jgi:hypothetical protein
MDAASRSGVMVETNKVSHPLAYMGGIDRIAAVDVLYPIYSKLDNADFFARMKCSVDSLLCGDFTDFVICVCDTSPESLKLQLDAIIPIPYRYVHNPQGTPVETGYGRFSKPYTLNFGVKTLVTAPVLKLSDVDIVYSTDHMTKVLERITSGQSDVVTYKGHRMMVKFYHHHLPLLMAQGGEYLTTPGIPTMSTQCFHRLRGYNEDPDYVGLEDVEFLLRVQAAGLKLAPNWEGVTVAHLWHPKPWPAEQHAKDKVLHRQVQMDLESGKLKPDYVNQKGYGEPQGIAL